MIGRSLVRGVPFEPDSTRQEDSVRRACAGWLQW